MIEIDPNEVRCEDPAEGAALGLLGLMTGISEACWCASWLNRLEFVLWGAAPGRYGFGDISARQAALLLLLSEECDGWWFWDDKLKRPNFVRRAEWIARVAERARRRGGAA